MSDQPWGLPRGRKDYPDPPHEPVGWQGVSILGMWLDEAALLDDARTFGTLAARDGDDVTLHELADEPGGVQ